MSDLPYLAQSLKLNFDYLRWGGRDLRWPLTNHTSLAFATDVELIENEVVVLTRNSTVAQFLKDRGGEWVLRVEIAPSHYWINLYEVKRSASAMANGSPLYNEWRGKDGTFNLYCSDGLISKAHRRSGIYWFHQEPLISVKQSLTVNSREFIRLRSYSTASDGLL